MDPRRLRSTRALALAFSLAVVAAAQAQAQRVTSPKEHFGFAIGDDYHLATYTQFQQYWARLDAESDRMQVSEIGKTAEGRPQLMALVSAPENLREAERYRRIAERLAKAEGLTDAEARALAREGKAIVWIDGGLHATEVLGAHQLIETVYQLVSRDDAETRRILDDVIVVAVHANPDGMELVSSWYMREPVPEKRTTAGVPRLYQKYVGHDNNRDFYLSSQAETRNMNRLMYRTWFPQIMYNHHQTGPMGTVMFAPPFRDPFNYNIDPLIIESLNLVGAAMHARFAAEDKPGVTQREGASYSTWWNGGLRTTAYFKNIIGLLTETIGHPTPMSIPFVMRTQLPNGDLPFPIEPQRWHFRQSVDYSVTANYAVLDLASRYRETLLHNIYLMGKRSIERGSRDSWTMAPRRIAAAEAALARDKATPGAAQQEPDYFGRRPEALTAAQFREHLRRPEDRDARGYILPADQPDFATATRFVNAFLDNGVAVHRATRDFEVAGKRYPAGSYVVRTAQAFRPHVLDMFEPQDHPNDIPYPGAAPKPPYDNAGYTLAYQMGVKFDRIVEGFDGPFEVIQGVDIRPPAGKIAGAAQPRGYLFSHQVNDAFVAINRLLKAGQEVYWLKGAQTVDGRSWPAGTFYVPATSAARPILERVAAEKGVDFAGTAARPQGEAVKLRLPRIALWDRYGGSMPSGWTRWLFEQFEFPFQVVYPGDLDAGKLASKYDVILFVDEAVPARDGAAQGGWGAEEPAGAALPDSLRRRMGRVSVATTVPQLRAFMDAGGTVIAIGGSTVLAQHLGLPVTDALTEPGPNGQPRRIASSRFYIPGSVLTARVDPAHPLAAGITDPVDILYDNSPAFTLGADAEARGVRRVAWFDTDRPLRSGWAWGQERLKGTAQVVEARVGKGELYLFAPEITFRAQPHGTFKFLFNAIHYGSGEATRLP